MKTKYTLIALFVIVCFLTRFTDITLAEQRSEAFMPERTFNFESVWDGDTVTHDFILINKGTAPLEITKIETDCGCTAASAEDVILPGKESKITLSLDTHGYGGHSVRKITKVHTNDPDQKVIRLELSGLVKAFVLLEPGHIELKGIAGQAISSTVIITPAVADMDFKIAQITAKENKNIRFEIRRNDEIIPGYYELIVENTKTDPGRYFDLITIWTDTSRKIYIRVFGNILP